MNVHVFKDATTMSGAAAEWITDYIAKHLAANNRFTWLLSGGNTPKELYELLAKSPYRERIEWTRIHIFFGDERFVSFDDPRNNGRMAFDHLLRVVPVPSGQIHFIPTDIEEAEAAKQYEEILHDYFPDNAVTFDLALLGLGNDGHTLSLFPGTGTVHEQQHRVITAHAPVEPIHRITLTASSILPSRCIAFLVSGSSKAAALQQVLQGDFDPDRYPAQTFREHKNIHWFADREAMKLVNIPKS